MSAKDRTRRGQTGGFKSNEANKQRRDTRSLPKSQEPLNLMFTGGAR